MPLRTWGKHGHMMTSSHGNIFRVIDPLWGESTGHWWIPLTKAGDTVIWCFLWYAPEQTVKQTIETLVIWDAIALIVTSFIDTKPQQGRTRHKFVWESLNDEPMHLNICGLCWTFKGHIFTTSLSRPEMAWPIWQTSNIFTVVWNKNGYRYSEKQDTHCFQILVDKIYSRHWITFGLHGLVRSRIISVRSIFRAHLCVSSQRSNPSKLYQPRRGLHAAHSNEPYCMVDKHRAAYGAHTLDNESNGWLELKFNIRTLFF